ncbi:polyprenyl synthetase family protein [Actinomycetospora chibensis]|jgi:geranylgeranyl diphosphate synthase, type I|uniref:Polyprenyl synthetase family protein n=1 Tax=Actinomycetospora chibensis TaxID=663606 RepID=A0ABV9RMB8_9PSEU|nr:polyprenyl synthetase family protein [Actinomycetospora chibensis]MDD7925460.1 polyprenyl synthetase family protein [Actinomycetospora chibensis]
MTLGGVSTRADHGAHDPFGSPAEQGGRAIEHDLPGAVTADLADYLAGRRAECADIAEEYAGAVDDLTRFVLAGGKRLRPTFAWWGWRAAGGLDDPSAVLRAVSALELIQACALVHDDLIDDSATRRGEPTVHARWASRHAGAAWTGDPTRFGAAVAILLGDVALAWADDMLHESGVDPVALARARPAWQAMRTEVLGGQFLDVQGHASSDSSPETALRISRYKTAAYTVERPLHLGAAIAGADDTTIAALRRYGTDLGIAFQLRDDMLGVFGDPAVTGKPAGDDLREGKLTLLVALTRAHPDRTTAAVVERAVGNPHLDAEGVAAAREALVSLGVVDDVERRITELTASALDAVRGADAPVLAVPAPDRLADLAVAATRRAR